ncbi:diguanylate cyclase [Paenibacillus sp. GCM10027626]|uniref:sensor domain-containing diguanylate cyclase n=1 Tax=Paenibacillus sp. GCM10027626 TaxID=3273411 RepID=UPI0036407CAC
MARTRSLSKENKKISLIILLPLLISLSIVLTAITLIVVSYRTEKDSLFQTTLELNYDSAAKMSQTITTLFKSMRQNLQSTASYVSKHYENSQIDLQAELDQIHNSSNYFNSLFWADETGLIRHVSPSSVGIAGKPLSTKAGQAAFTSRKPYLSPPYIGSTNRLIVLMSYPVFDQNGRYRGMIGGTIYLQEPNIINDIFGSSSTNETGSYFYIVGPEGNLIYHPDTARLGENVSGNPIVQRLSRGESGKDQVVNSRGTANLAGYSSVADNDWGVVMQTPEDAIYEQLDKLVKDQLLNMMLPVIIMMACAIWIAIKLARPFVGLSSLAVRLSEGETVAKTEFLPHWNKEAHRLSRAMSLAVEANERQAAMLAKDAATDQLTGLFNRRAMEEATGQWIAAALPYAIIVVDIDRFKSVNDTYGHHVGDEVLKHLAAIMLQAARPSDICCRFGGEEFVILLPHTDQSGALEIAERLRTAMETTLSPTGKPVTVSLGIAQYPLQAQTAEQLFQCADAALYKAKRDGRNRAVVAEASAVPM